MERQPQDSRITPKNRQKRSHETDKKKKPGARLLSWPLALKISGWASSLIGLSRVPIWCFNLIFLDSFSRLERYAGSLVWKHYSDLEVLQQSYSTISKTRKDLLSNRERRCAPNFLFQGFFLLLLSFFFFLDLFFIVITAFIARLMSHQKICLYARYLATSALL